jgi:hypothetical protein
MHSIPKETLRNACNKINGEYALYASVQKSERLCNHGGQIFRACSTIKVLFSH